MASYTWTGTNSGDFNDTGNWAEGAVPSTNDNITFKYGNVSLTTNIDKSTTNFGKISIMPGYTGTIGLSTSTPFKFGCSSLRIEGGGGANPIYIGSGAATSYDIEKFVMWGAGSNRATPVYFCTGTVVDMAMYAGSLNIVAGTITNSVFKEANPGLGGINVVLQAPTMTAMEVYSGTIRQTSTGTITTGRMYGGNLNIDLGTITTCYVGGTANVNWISTTAAITNLYCLGGIFDMNGSTSARTITNMTIHEGATFNDPNNAATFTNNYVYYGGTVRRSSPSSEYLVP